MKKTMKKTMKKLTDKQKKAYLKNYNKCPHCQSDQIGGGFVEVDGDTACQIVGCNDCDKQWYDIYNLVDVVEVE